MRQFRDAIRSMLPVWLSERPTLDKTVGFRLLWAIAALIDASSEFMLQALRARFPGVGTPTALLATGADRRIVRGVDDTDEEYIARLRGWLETHARSGSLEAVARAVHDYLPGRPKVRVINRHGWWGTIEAGWGAAFTVAKYSPSIWNFDGSSNPERFGAASRSEVFIVVYDSYARAGDWGDPDGDTFGVAGGTSLGMSSLVRDMIMMRTLVDEFKSAASRVRCVIFTNDPTDFDPVAASTFMGPPTLIPNGWWGHYAKFAPGNNSVPARPINHLRFVDHESAP